jgi:hypothetical protein
MNVIKNKHAHCISAIQEAIKPMDVSRLLTINLQPHDVDGDPLDSRFSRQSNSKHSLFTIKGVGCECEGRTQKCMQQRVVK